MRKMWVVTRDDGFFFAGISTITGRAMWFDAAGDYEHMSSAGALRFKRDARWLAQAHQTELNAKWTEI